MATSGRFIYASLHNLHLRPAELACVVCIISAQVTFVLHLERRPLVSNFARRAGASAKANQQLGLYRKPKPNWPITRPARPPARQPASHKAARGRPREAMFLEATMIVILLGRANEINHNNNKAKAQSWVQHIILPSQALSPALGLALLAAQSADSRSPKADGQEADLCHLVRRLSVGLVSPPKSTRTH